MGNVHICYSTVRSTLHCSNIPCLLYIVNFLEQHKNPKQQKNPIQQKDLRRPFFLLYWSSTVVHTGLVCEKSTLQIVLMALVCDFSTIQIVLIALKLISQNLPGSPYKDLITVELQYSRKNGRRKSFYYIGFFYYFGFLCCSRKLTMQRRQGISEQCISYQVLTQVDKLSINQSFILEYLLVLRL